MPSSEGVWESDCTASAPMGQEQRALCWTAVLVEGHPPEASASMVKGPSPGLAFIDLMLLRTWDVPASRGQRVTGPCRNKHRAARTGPALYPAVACGQLLASRTASTSTPGLSSSPRPRLGAQGLQRELPGLLGLLHRWRGSLGAPSTGEPGASAAPPAGPPPRTGPGVKTRPFLIEGGCCETRYPLRHSGKKVERSGLDCGLSESMCVLRLLGEKT